MQKAGLASPLLVKYLRAYEQNPKSRVFAPLAETYRKLGMKEKAFAILKKGIKNHPAYPMGYLGLAFYYKDAGNQELAYSTLRPFVGGNRDNIRLQKLFGNVCHDLGYLEEALDTFKFLLFINPKDAKIAEKVAELEVNSNFGQAINDYAGRSEIPVDEISLFSEESFETTGWVQKDFTKPVEKEAFKRKQIKQLDREKEKKTDLFGEHGAFDIESIPEDKNSVPVEEREDDLRAPVITLTLVDLYCSQGYFQKAKEVLDKIKVLNPDDSVIDEKYKEIESAQFGEERENNLVFPALDQDYNFVESKLVKFLTKIKKRAEDFKEVS
jgi:tetratricopeptide (TPR) repeat protein